MPSRRTRRRVASDGARVHYLVDAAALPLDGIHADAAPVGCDARRRPDVAHVFGFRDPIGYRRRALVPAARQSRTCSSRSGCSAQLRKALKRVLDSTLLASAPRRTRPSSWRHLEVERTRVISMRASHARTRDRSAERHSRRRAAHANAPCLRRAPRPRRTSRRCSTSVAIAERQGHRASWSTRLPDSRMRISCSSGLTTATERRSRLAAARARARRAARVHLLGQWGTHRSSSTRTPTSSYCRPARESFGMVAAEAQRPGRRRSSRTAAVSPRCCGITVRSWSSYDAAAVHAALEPCSPTRSCAAGWASLGAARAAAYGWPSIAELAGVDLQAG